MPTFKENPGGMKPSGYKMKYQGNHSAFPFKESPVKEGVGAAGAGFYERDEASPRIFDAFRSKESKLARDRKVALIRSQDEVAMSKLGAERAEAEAKERSADRLSRSARADDDEGGNGEGNGNGEGGGV